MKNDTTSKNKTKEKKLQLKARRRHERVYSILWHLLHRPAAGFFHCDIERAPETEGSCLILSNHNTDVDFLFLGSSFKRHMYFVISEHTMQHGFASKLLRHYLAPISRLKGATAASTAMNVIRTLRSGSNVCIFAEGNRSFNGETCPILPSTGKLARSAGASLITYRIEGGYMVSPRWAYSLRRGKMRAHIVNIYSPEQLRAMTDDEINEAIKNDLYEDAYARQAEWKAVYKGKKLAEGLEHILFICPECGGISTISTNGSRISCTCGMSGKYNKHGYISGTSYNTVLDWDRWQQKRLPEIIDCAGNDCAAIFSDDDISLIAVDSEHNSSQLAAGTLSISRSALSIAGREFPLSEIEGNGLAIYGHANIVFNHNGIHYELKSDKRFCAVKYTRAFSYITAESEETAPAGI